MSTLKPATEIIPEAIFFQQTNLICEISPTSFSYVFENDVDKKFYGLSVFHFNNDVPIDQQLKEIFGDQPLLCKNYKKIFLSISMEQCALLPEELYSQEENALLLDTLYGDLYETATATDLIANKKIYSVYRVPVNIHRALADQFPLAIIYHHYSLLAKQDFRHEEMIKIIIYTNTFIAVVIKHNRLQFIQTYSYKSAADIVYHLLNICKQLAINNPPLLIAGSVEANSDVYKEIKHYFRDVIFDPLPPEYEFATGLKNLPSHYFSYLYSLASCV